MKRARIPRREIREILMGYIRECKTPPPGVADSLYAEETWFAQNARLIDACIAFPSATATAPPRRRAGVARPTSPRRVRETHHLLNMERRGASLPPDGMTRALPSRANSVHGSLSMSRTIHAVYENGVFRPTKPVDLPEHTAVEFEPRIKESSPSAPMSEGLAKVYAILGERYDSGHADTAARHDEHQP